MADTAPRAALLMGSDSDFPKLEGAVQTFADFGVACEVRVMSAHRTPARVIEYVADAEKRGVEVFLAAAGGAAHLAGVVAAHTIRPVVGIPIAGTSLNGLDSLLSTVQMPAGVPVATVAVGSAGGTNAALLAVQILGVADASMAEKLRTYKQTLAEKVAKKNAALQDKLSS